MKREDEFAKTGLTFEKIKEALRFYVYNLELAAGRFEEDRNQSALDSVNLTGQFLKSIGVYGVAFRPLIEAAEIIQAQRGKLPLTQDRAALVYRAVALRIQTENGVSEAVALKKIVGRDAAAGKKLKNFTKAMLREDCRYPVERGLYEAVRSDHKTFAPPVVVEMMLHRYRSLRGKKV
jgi:hypothetical protein